MRGFSWGERVSLSSGATLYKGVNTYSRLKISSLAGIHQDSREKKRVLMMRPSSR